MRNWLRIIPIMVLSCTVAGLSSHAVAAPPTTPTPTRTSTPGPRPTAHPTTPPAPTATPTGQIPAELADAVRRDLGQSWEEFARQGLTASQASAIGRQLASVPGFNDVRLEAGVIVATGQGTPFQQAASDLGVRTRNLTPALSPDEAAGQVAERLGPATVLAAGHTDNGATVTVDQAVVSEAQRHDTEQALSGLEIERSSRPKTQLTVAGGQGVNFVDSNGQQANCLTGFTLRDPQDKPGILTAGHCTRDGQATTITVTDTTKNPPGKTPLGTIRFSQFGGPGNTPTDPDFPDNGTDLAVVTTNPQISTAATVPAGTNGLGRITGQTSPVLGTNVCRFSATTGWGCGAIAQTNTTYTAAGPTGQSGDLRGVTGFVVSNLSSTDGDSGSPVVAGTLAVGILTARATISGTNVIYAVPTDALAQYLPNSHLQLWVPEPVAQDTANAGTSHATAAWQPGQTIHGNLPANPGENTANLTVTIRLDDQPLTTTTTDTSGNYTFTLPQTMTPAPDRHTVTITASNGQDTSTALTVHLPYKVEGAMADAWVRNHGADGPLGVPTEAPACGLKDNGCYQPFEHGMIYTANGVPATAIHGPIYTKWAEQSWENGFLGYPNGDQVCGIAQGGCYQNFQHGAILWSPDTGAHDSVGDIRTKWAATGYEQGPLGYPTSDVTCGLRDGGCFQNYQSGSILWKKTTGAWISKGAIRQKYAETNYENGFLGYPIADELCGLRDGGCHQAFEGGSILWSANTGGHTLTGVIRQKYESVNSENSRMGYPRTDEICGMRDGGCRQDFQDGTIMWSLNTGAHPIWGAINDKYTTVGREGGILGYPTTDEICGLKNGGCNQNFQYDKASIYWVSYRGAHYIRGAIKDRWGAMGYENNPNLDYPSSDETCGLKNSGCAQQFGKADNTSFPRSIYYSTTTGAHEVIFAGTLEQWAAAGWENGRYGYPIGAPGTGTTGSYIQQFQGGWITTNKP